LWTKVAVVSWLLGMLLNTFFSYNILIRIFYIFTRLEQLSLENILALWILNHRLINLNWFIYSNKVFLFCNVNQLILFLFYIRLYGFTLILLCFTFMQILAWCSCTLAIDTRRLSWLLVPLARTIIITVWIILSNIGLRQYFIQRKLFSPVFSKMRKLFKFFCMFKIKL